MRAKTRLLVLPFVLAACSFDPVGPLSFNWPTGGGCTSCAGGGGGIPARAPLLVVQSAQVFLQQGYDGVDLLVGDSATFRAVWITFDGTPQRTDNGGAWQSSNPAAITITGDGRALAVGIGTATITYNNFVDDVVKQEVRVVGSASALVAEPDSADVRAGSSFRPVAELRLEAGDSVVLRGLSWTPDDWSIVDVHDPDSYQPDAYVTGQRVGRTVLSTRFRRLLARMVVRVS